MKGKNIVKGLMLVLIFSFLLTGCGIVKVVKIGEEGKYTGEEEFNAGDDVAIIWEKSIIPELEEKAVDLKEFLTEANGDLTSLAEKYGKYSMGTSGELSYIVRGTGTVEEIDNQSKAGYISVKLEDYIGEEDIKIQIGSVYKGSSIRDSLSFIKFGDYTNQKDWAAVSQSINELVDKEVIQPADPDSLKGKSISFVGAFTVSTGSTDILITPVKLEKE